MGRKKKVDALPLVNPQSAGIDVGSKSHFVAIGQDKDDVREFGVYSDNLHELCKWLVAEEISTVALESTGSYWQNLFLMLQDYGLNPILVSGKFTKNVQGKKTDVLDCQWIQRLHTLGLLPNSYQPNKDTEKLRQYSRHRQGLIENASDYIKKMQKSLRLMNIRLDIALSDVTGKSGRAMVEAIIGGEKDPTVLADLANYRVRKSKEEIIQALTGVWKEEFVFELRQSYELYKFFHAKIEECDKAIEKCLIQNIEDNEKIDGEVRPDYDKSGRKKRNKNTPKIDIEKLAFQLTGGIDLSAIDGVSSLTILNIVAEIGTDVSDFPTAKHFTSWLRLAPNNKISGGKPLSRHTPKHKHRLALAFERAANVVGHNLKEGALHQFFQRIKYKKGNMQAIIATARKIAVIVWNMLSKKEPFKPVQDEVYSDKMRNQVLKNLQRKIKSFNIKPEEIAFATI